MKDQHIDALLLVAKLFLSIGELMDWKYNPALIKTYAVYLPASITSKPRKEKSFLPWPEPSVILYFTVRIF